MPAATAVKAVTVSDDPQEYEDEHVHSVYDEIAPHFSSTRYKDYAISIATIHHLSTPARRKLAVQQLIESISPAHGRALVYVWAIEQDELSKRSIPTECSTNNPVTDSAKGKDVFVPWVLSSRSASEEKSKIPTSHDATAEANKVFNRYYHMFAQGELRQLVEEAARDLGLLIGSAGEGKGGDGDVPVRGLEIAQDGWERSNYFVEITLEHSTFELSLEDGNNTGTTNSAWHRFTASPP
ncbi:hypothetical protein EVJ58_g10935 [Rhodofomes roseus]|uniref:Methyltransferase type 11 domain-containing protein n=1 Tax=Rhodofomes roseus TaxID=34475 RepID=A0A4Y9XKY4_9APHY|nr:hypothetical protein EVJ58_g10935 [Rhodofomes roseus]